MFKGHQKMVYNLRTFDPVIFKFTVHQKWYTI